MSKYSAFAVPSETQKAIEAAISKAAARHGVHFSSCGLKGRTDNSRIDVTIEREGATLVVFTVFAEDAVTNALDGKIDLHFRTLAH